MYNFGGILHFKGKFINDKKDGEGIEYYSNGKEIIMFSDLDELIILIKYYLENSLEREFIRTRGYNRTASHTYDQRIKDLFSKLEEFEKG